MFVEVDADALKGSDERSALVGLSPASPTEFEVEEDGDEDASLEFSAGSTLAEQVVVRQNGRWLALKVSGAPIAVIGFRQANGHSRAGGGSPFFDATRKTGFDPKRSFGLVRLTAQG